MQAVKSKGTRPERQLFAMLAGMRLVGWRKHADDLIGKPDAVFLEANVALFVDGCFWHGCPHCNRKLPEANREYWALKIERNAKRDDENTQSLKDEGWQVIRIWEHEMRNPNARQALRKNLLRALR